jgi:hypothetical protein
VTRRCRSDIEPIRVGSVVTYRHRGERSKFSATCREIRDGVVELVGANGYLTLHPELHVIVNVRPWRES